MASIRPTFILLWSVLQFATSAFPALVRLGTAGFVGSGIETFKRPAKTLELYEFQACPLCRKVGLLYIPTPPPAYNHDASPF